MFLRSNFTHAQKDAMGGLLNAGIKRKRDDRTGQIENVAAKHGLTTNQVKVSKQIISTHVIKAMYDIHLLFSLIHKMKYC